MALMKIERKHEPGLLIPKTEYVKNMEEWGEENRRLTIPEKIALGIFVVYLAGMFIAVLVLL